MERTEFNRCVNVSSCFGVKQIDHGVFKPMSAQQDEVMRQTGVGQRDPTAFQCSNWADIPHASNVTDGMEMVAGALAAGVSEMSRTLPPDLRVTARLSSGRRAKLQSRPYLQAACF